VGRRGAGIRTRILLVDDDQAVLSGLRRALTLEGFEILTEESGEAALETARLEQPDLVVLDLMLPGIDGLEVCRRLREGSGLPVLMLTAKDSVTDRVAGLNRGADDYLVKPFATDELVARINALLRRASGPAAETLSYADLKLDASTREVFRGDERLRLTRLEYELLAMFMRHRRQALSRDQLCQQVWGYAFDGESNFVDVAIKDLRKKLEAGDRRRLIQTVRGYGYALREE
jgi:two-component system response regulator MprA